jgi:WD40 repeat protein
VPAALGQGQVKDGPQASRLLQRLGTNQLRHGSRILCLAYSPNGQILAAGGGSDPVRVWDANTGQQKFTCNETWINSILFSPRGSVIVTGGEFKSIRLWEAATGKDAGKLDGHKYAVKALALSPDGTLLVSGGQDGVIILWEMLTKKQITALKEHTGEVTSLAFCPAIDVPLFVSGSNDRTIRVWDADNNKVKTTIDARCGVLAVAISPNGKTVFSAGDDNLIRSWDAETGKLQDTFKGHDDMVVSLAVTRDGKTLVSGGRDKSIRLWNLQAKNEPPRIIPRHLGDSDALALSKDGTRIATAGINNTIRIFEAASGKELLVDGPQAGLAGLTLSRDGKFIAAVTAPGIVYLWNAASGKLLRDWSTGHVGEITLGFTPDGQSLVTAAETIRFWDPQTGKQRFELPPPAALRSPHVLSLAFSPDGKMLAVGVGERGLTEREGHVVFYSIENRKAGDTFKYPGHPYAVAFSQDSKLLAVSGGSKIVLWDRDAHKELRRFDCKEAPPKTLLPDVAALAFSPDKTTLAVACFDGIIRVLNYEGNKPGKEVSVCEGHVSVPYAIAYSHDGRTLLSGSFDSTVRAWEPFSGAQLAELKGHSGPVYGVALSPDGRIAYSAAADTNVIIWDMPGFGKNGPPKAALGNAEFEQVWRDLAREDAAAARLVAWRLIANPQGVSDFLKTKVPLVDVQKIKQMLVDLDSENFDDRDAAYKGLESQGQWMRPRLKEALEKPPSLEYKRRIEKLLEILDAQGALSLRQEQLRLRRSMMVLEYIADPVALDLLDKLTRQAPEDALCHEAQVTLQRLGKNPPTKTAGQ